MYDEEIWKEPEHYLEGNELYGSDKMYDNAKSFRIFSMPEHKSAFGLNLRDGRLVRAGQLLLEGKSINTVSKRTRICRKSVQKLFIIVLAQYFQNNGSEILCQCNKRSTHGGICLYRRKDKARNIELKYGCICIRPNIEILDCGCFVEKIFGARLIQCNSEECFYE